MRSRLIPHLHRRLTYANVMATAAVVIALGGTGTAIAAVIVTSNAQVAKDTISGHAPPAGSHSNLIKASVNAADLAAAYKTSVKVHCPADMQLGGGLCFETSLRPATDIITAIANCSQAQRRLPTAAELALVFNGSGAPQDDQWVDQVPVPDGPSSYLGAALNEDSSRNISFDLVTYSLNVAYRCVTTPTN